MRIIISFFVFSLLFTFPNTIMGQELENDKTSENDEVELVEEGSEDMVEEEGERESVFGLRSVSLSVGKYSPGMDFWNENSPVRWDNKFDGAIFDGGPIIDGNIELRFSEIFRGRVHCGYWKDNVSKEFNDGTHKKFEIGVIPLGADLLIELVNDPSAIFQPYVGVGGGTCFLSLKNEDTSPTGKNTSSKGQDMMYFFIQGAEFPISPSLSFGTEVRLTFGKFVQRIEKINAQGYEPHDISLRGPQILFSLTYLIGERYEGFNNIELTPTE